ncbi:MAG: T9SS type A sorting domain-containing protein [Bacteroidia bacterium]
MRKIYLFAFSIVFAGFSMAQSPIILTSTNMPVLGDTLRYTNAQVSSVGNYTQTGANFSWNFSSLVFTSQGVRNFQPSSQTPYFFFFTSPGEYGEKIADTLGAGPLTITKYYNYYKKQTTPLNAFIADGSGMTFSSIPVPAYFSDKDELYVFPLNYLDHDSTTFKFSTPTTTAIPIRYSKTGYRITNVDGWGTITTPYGTDSCLRIVSTQYSKDTVKYQTFPFGFLNYQRSYQWMTKTSKIPFLEISGTLNGTNFTPNQVRYKDNYISTAGVHENTDLSAMEFYPNPGKNELWLNFSRKGSFLVEILDLAGKSIKAGSFDSGISGQSLDISGLSPALYVIKVSEGQRNYFYKFIKE